MKGHQDATSSADVASRLGGMRVGQADLGHPFPVMRQPILWAYSAFAVASLGVVSFIWRGSRPSGCGSPR